MPEDRRKRAVTGMSIGTATALRRSRRRFYVYAFVFLIYFPSTCWTGVAQKRRRVISFRPAKRRKVLLSFNAICYTTKCEATVFPYRSDAWNNTETTGGGGVPVLIYTLDEIRRIVLPIAQKYRLPAVYLFGSYARGAATEDSDLDFLVDTTGTELKSLFSLGSLYNDLADAFQRPIDLITVSSLTQRTSMPSEEQFRETVWKEKITLYDAA